MRLASFGWTQKVGTASPVLTPARRRDRSVDNSRSGDPVASRSPALRGAHRAAIRATVGAALLFAAVIVAVELLLGTATSGEHFPTPSPAPAPAVLVR
jgi:hypothetical protein